MDKIRPSSRVKPRGAIHNVDTAKEFMEVELYEIFRGVEFNELAEWIQFLKSPLCHKMASFYQDKHTEIARDFLEATVQENDLENLNQLRGMVKGMKLFMRFFDILKKEYDERRKHRQSAESIAASSGYRGG